MTGGNVELSVEVELGWGYHDLDRKPSRLSSDRLAETIALERLLSRCDEFSIPVTFNIVGHLLLTKCSGNHDLPYPDGWLSKDPGTDFEQAPMFYAPDLVERIQNTKVNHEICTHTFTHILCDEVDESIVDADLRQTQKLHKDIFGKPTQSLVPPRHCSVPENILSRRGINVVRQTIGEIPSNPLRRFLWYFYRRHPVIDPVKSGDLTLTFTSPVQSLTAPYLPAGQEPPHPAFRLLPLSLRKKSHIFYIRDALNRAVEQKSHIHLWTHLHDMANEHQLDIVDRTLQEISSKVEAKKITVLRMCDLAD